MTVTSNLYAEKVYAEHPIALYALDESADYVSLISEAQRTISAGNGWTTSNVSSTGVYSGTTTTAVLDTVLNQITVPDTENPVLTLTATNLVTVPQAAATWSRGFGTGGAGTSAVQVDSRFPGQKAYEIAWTTLPSNNSGLYIQTTSNAGLATGSTYRLSIRFSATNWSGIVPAFYVTTGTLGASSLENLGSGLYEFRQLYTHSTGSSLTVTFNPSGTATMSSGATLRAGGASIVLSSSLLEDYFDGDSQDGTEAGQFSYAWTTPGSPNSSTSTKKMIGTVPTTISTMTSPIILSGPSFGNESGSFSIGTYLYPFAKKLFVELGFTYTDLSTGLPATTLREFSIPDVQQWTYLSETFETPTNFSNLKVVIRVTTNGPTGTYEGLPPYYFLLHGLTVGQWSEQFQVESLGSAPVSIPTTVSPIVSGYGVELNRYGLQTVSGYYMVENSMLTAVNSGVPMVYGASNSTRITPRNSGLSPSLVIPGQNFFSQSGRYRDMTAEFWIKIQSFSTDYKKIFGPVASDDGLYVHDGFISLKVGKESGTYYIAEWDRPMLVAIRLSSDSASLIINGELAADLNFKSSEVIFPNAKDSSGKDQDWLGFYAHPDVPVLEVDCIAIYPYSVPNIVEKRRWVYGQGVELVSNVAGTDPGASILFDYSFANYSKNYIYPDIGRWQQGINENLLIENNTISNLQYELPSIVFSDQSKTQAEWNDKWLLDNEYLQDEELGFVSLRPNTDLSPGYWDNNASYMLFPTINTLSQDLKAFYISARSDETNTKKQTLFRIENDTTGDFLEAYLIDTVITYSFTTGDGTIVGQELQVQSDHTPGWILVVGIDINKLVSYFGDRLVSFFGSRQNLKFYVGGTKEFNVEDTFTGKIYSVGFCTSRNLEKISYAFAENGICLSYSDAEESLVADAGDKNFGNTTDYVDPANGNTYWSDFADAGDSYFGNAPVSFDRIIDGGSPYSILSNIFSEHIASYTLKPKTFLGKFYIDIASNGYWQDYLPLSYFTKYVTDGNGDKYLDVDFIQFNVNYPQINGLLASTASVENSVVRTYVSFQYLKDPASISASASAYLSSNSLLNQVVIPGSEWQTTKYEVVNGSVIYPPPDIDYNSVSMVIHLEVLSKGLKENPIKIQSIQLASQSLDSFKPNPVGTRLGSDVFPYKKSGEYFDYKGRNPYSIYKGNTPYFYLTSTSGIRVRKLNEAITERGISIPVNRNLRSFYKVSAWQMALRWDEESFPTVPQELFEIKSNGKSIKAYVVADTENAKRGRLYVIDADTGLKQSGVTFYMNGRKVRIPMLELKAWTVLGISFSSPLDFTLQSGALRITGDVVFNNVSHYESTESEESSKFSYRKWFDVSSINGIGKDWYYWRNLQVVPGEEFTWKDVLFISSAQTKQVLGSDMYKKYTGTDRFVVDTDSVFRVNGYKYLFYSNLEWKSTSVIPV